MEYLNKKRYIDDFNYKHKNLMFNFIIMPETRI